MPDSLPIDAILPELCHTLAEHARVIVSALPGAGKTTRVPLALLHAEWLSERRIVMLEPRRIAARSAAEYMAGLLGEKVGGTVGYRIRGEMCVGPSTRVEVVTEGILTRMLQDQPDLPGVGTVIFDEFHERSLHADLGLALTLDVQMHLRPDLRVLVMSATLDHVAIAELLGDAPTVASEGTIFPVETRYLMHEPEARIDQRVRDAVVRALRENDGDVLVFLPGQREIRWTMALLEDEQLKEEVVVHALYANASPESQRAALLPPAPGRRKVILATSIAETSLTIDGVSVVIDAGLSRVPRFDPRRGMAGLVTTPVSRASADQRRGRAGRQRPGVCYRLWTEQKQASLPEFSSPEILNADLTPLALDLAVWGTPDGKGLRFLDPPPAAHLSQARNLLIQLNGLAGDGAVTRHGRAMSSFPVHPRLAHMMLMGRENGEGAAACELAALLEERDILRGGRDVDVDLESRWSALQHGGGDRAVAERVRKEAARLKTALGVAGQSAKEPHLGLMLALAYPDRVARRRSVGSGRYLMSGGVGAVLPSRSVLGKEEFLAIGDVDGVGIEVRIGLTSPLSATDILSAFGGILTRKEEVLWNEHDESVIGKRTVNLGVLPVEDAEFVPDNAQAAPVLCEAIRRMGLTALPWTRGSESLRQRSEWFRRKGIPVCGGESAGGESWPDLSDQALLVSLDAWLVPFLGGVLRRSQFDRIDLTAALRSLFTYEQLRRLDRLVPETVKVPTGADIRLEYDPERTPVLAVPLQAMFGERETPRICNGKVPVLLHLLSPARRPVAVTQDLAGFWKSGYVEVRKEMRGRYPKHSWPDDPANAAPERGARRRR